MVLSILSLPEGPPPTSFVHDVFDLMNNVGKNFYELLICENTMKLPVIHNDIQEDVRNTLQDCLRNWNIGAKSKEKGVQDHHEGVCTSFGNHAITPSRPIFLSITPLRPIFS